MERPSQGQSGWLGQFEAVLGNRPALTRLEHILHPMVEAEERAFVQRARRARKRAVVLDIPLLFETQGERRVDPVPPPEEPEVSCPCGTGILACVRVVQRTQTRVCEPQAQRP